MLVVLGVVCLTALGLVATFPTRRSLSPLEFLAMSFGIGGGIATLSVFLLLAVGLAVSGLRTVLLIVGAVILVGTARMASSRYRVGLRLPRITKPCLAPLDWLLLSSIACAVAGVAVVALYWPPHTWDALAIWMAKARAIALSQSVEAIRHGAAHPSYPLHLPLQLSFVMQLAGVGMVKVLFPLYYTALLVVFATSLARFSHRSVALGFTLLLATVPFVLQHATIAYADLTFAFFYVGGTLLLHRATTSEELNEQGDLFLLTGLLLGIASWTRPEGLLYFAINSVVLAAFAVKQRIRLTSLAKYAVGYGAFAVPWLLYSRAMGYHNSLFETVVAASREAASTGVDLGRIGSILVYLSQQAADTSTWGWLCILFLAAVVLYPKHVRTNGFLLSVIGVNIVGLVLQYYVAATGGNRLSWWLTTGLNRMALHFAPLLLFYTGLCFNDDLVAWGARAKGRLQFALTHKIRA